MTNARRVLPAAIAALLLAGSAGCATDEATPAPTPANTPSPESPEAMASSSADVSPSQIAADSASDLVRRYYVVRDDLRHDPSLALDALEAVTTSTELDAQEALFERERQRGLAQTGDTVIGDLRVQAVNLDNSDPGAGKAPTVQVDVCWDVSEVDILDANGESIVSSDRPDSGWIRYSVVNHTWDADRTGGWRVATSHDLERTACAAS